MDFYAAHGNTVESLPFHATNGYHCIGGEAYPREIRFNHTSWGPISAGCPAVEQEYFRFDYRREPAAPPN